MPPGACAARARHSARWSVVPMRCGPARCDAMCQTGSRPDECASAGMTGSGVFAQVGSNGLRSCERTSASTWRLIPATGSGGLRLSCRPSTAA
jgi:hypothetical protein